MPWTLTMRTKRILAPMKNKQTKKKADQVVPWMHAMERAVEAVVDERRLNAWKTRNRGLAICQLAIAPVKKIQK